MVSFDVVSLFTNVPLDECIMVGNTEFENGGDPITLKGCLLFFATVSA